jgi:hypothetical protein
MATTVGATATFVPGIQYYTSGPSYTYGIAAITSVSDSNGAMVVSLYRSEDDYLTNTVGTTLTLYVLGYIASALLVSLGSSSAVATQLKDGQNVDSGIAALATTVPSDGRGFSFTADGRFDFATACFASGTRPRTRHDAVLAVRGVRDISFALALSETYWLAPGAAARRRRRHTAA